VVSVEHCGPHGLEEGNGQFSSVQFIL